MNLNKLRIDPSSFGSTMYLVGVAPYYHYNEAKQKTDIIEGYRYDVALAELGFDKLGVKIPGEKQLEAPASGMLAVAFTDLEAKAFVIKGEPVVTAKATKIAEVKVNAKA